MANWDTGWGRWPQLDETFPCMWPGWSADKVGADYMYMMISPRVAAKRLREGNGNWSGGGGGQPLGSVMNSDPRIPVVVYDLSLP